jgi:predicted flap endonuclease-1-like 5' DNA nuclease
MFQQSMPLGPGTGTFTDHTLEILIMLSGAFLIGLWLGWLIWSRYQRVFERYKTENESHAAAAMTLKSQMEDLNSRLSASESDRSGLKSELNNSNWENTELRQKLDAADGEREALLMRLRQLENELALGGGQTHTIGEQSTATAAFEWPQASAHQLDLALDTAVADGAAALNMAMFDIPAVEHVVHHLREHADIPDTMEVDSPADIPFEEAPSLSWVQPEVADMATPESPVLPKTDLLRPVIPPIGQVNADDLKIIEGIGPKIESLLHKQGIRTYQELATTPVERLKEILAEAGSRYALHDPGTWSAQALLAAEGQWENLKAYQSFLDAGKAPK